MLKNAVCPLWIAKCDVSMTENVCGLLRNLKPRLLRGRRQKNKKKNLKTDYLGCFIITFFFFQKKKVSRRTLSGT